MGYALSGITTLAQKLISSKGIASQPYQKSAVLSMMLGINGGGGEEWRIGRPNEGTILSGSQITDAQRLSMRNMSSYNPRIQGFKTYNTSVTGARTTMPSVANPTTNSQGQAVENAADFHWMAYLSTPVLVWHYDLDMALTKGGDSELGQGVQVAQVVQEAMDIALNEHYDQLACRLIYGSPTNQNAMPIDDLSGLQEIASSTNTYGNVNRGTLSAGDPWLGNLDTTFTRKDIYAIVQDANVTKKLASVGAGGNVVFCGGANYILFKNQILQRVGQANGVLPAGLPAMAKMGVEREVLRVDNCYVCWEPMLDSCPAQPPTGAAGAGSALYTAQPNDVYVANLKFMKLFLHPSYNVKIKPFVDLSDKGVNALRANQGFIETMAIFACDRPNVGLVRYTGLV